MHTRTLLREELRLRPGPVWWEFEARLRDHLRKAEAAEIEAAAAKSSIKLPVRGHRLVVRLPSCNLCAHIVDL